VRERLTADERIHASLVSAIAESSVTFCTDSETCDRGIRFRAVDVPYVDLAVESSGEEQRGVGTV
jgi:hypothetical protein